MAAEAVAEAEGVVGRISRLAALRRPRGVDSAGMQLKAAARIPPRRGRG